MFKYRWRVIWRDVLTNGASGSTDGVEEGKEEGDKSTVGGGADDKYVQEDAFDSLLRILARKAIINKRIGNVEFV